MWEQGFRLLTTTPNTDLVSNLIKPKKRKRQKQRLAELIQGRIR